MNGIMGRNMVFIILRGLGRLCLVFYKSYEPKQLPSSNNPELDPLVELHLNN